MRFYRRKGKNPNIKLVQLDGEEKPSILFSTVSMMVTAGLFEYCFMPPSCWCLLFNDGYAEFYENKTDAIHRLKELEAELI